MEETTKEVPMEPVQIPTNALVLISDGRHARLLRNQGTPVNPKLSLEREMLHENPSTREQGTDRPGRRQGSDSSNRSALEQTDWHQLEEQRFASEIAEVLYQLGHAGKYQDLVVVAPPKMLGDLRSQFHQIVTKAVIAEVPRDLTKYSAPEIGSMLS
jgi:protein required for attachment to host cells